MSLGQTENYRLLHRSSFDSESSFDFTARRPPVSLAGRAGYHLSRWIFTAFYEIKYLPKRLFGAFRYGKRTSYASCSFHTALRSIAVVVSFLFLLSILRAAVFPSYQIPPAHYEVLREAVTASTLPGRGNLNNEKIFIAANILKEDLIRGEWGRALLELVDLLGEENVFISIYENDSGPGTANALRELGDKLRCESGSCDTLTFDLGSVHGSLF